MTLEEFLTEKEEEYYTANLYYGGCSCAIGAAPCGFCEGGYSLPLDEFLLYAKEEWIFNNPEPENPHEAYERAMRALDL